MRLWGPWCVKAVSTEPAAAQSLYQANGEVVLSLLAATLPYRAFDKRVADQHLRSKRQQNDVLRSRIKAQVSSSVPRQLQKIAGGVNHVMLSADFTYLTKPEVRFFSY